MRGRRVYAERFRHDMKVWRDMPLREGIIPSHRAKAESFSALFVTSPTLPTSPIIYRILPSTPGEYSEKATQPPQIGEILSSLANILKIDRCNWGWEWSKLDVFVCPPAPCKRVGP